MKLSILLILLLTLTLSAQTTTPATQPAGIAHFPHLQLDLPNHEIRIDCQSLNPQMPLEFFCVLNGSSEHESVLRSAVRPMHLHTALLILGAAPGQSAKYLDAEKRWLPPTGQSLDLFVETARDGKTVREPAPSWMRNVKTHQPCQSFLWVFTGSRVMPDGNYAADITGYIATTVNFDLSVIDTPSVASSANETLQWEYNPDKVPPKGTNVTLIIRLADNNHVPTTKPQ